MARELHDGLAQELAFIRSQTAAMASGMPLPDMVGHVATAAERALEESRRAVETLAGGAPVPLREAVRAAAEEVAARQGAKVEVDVQASSIPPTVAEALLRVVREATGNAVRHGAARRVTVRLGCDNRSLRLTIVDDGGGFAPEGVCQGFGLRSMRERVEALGGQLDVRSQQGRGTTVEAVVPTSPLAHATLRRQRPGRQRTTTR